MHRQEFPAGELLQTLVMQDLHSHESDYRYLGIKVQLKTQALASSRLFS